MNYQKHYNRLIERARIRTIEGYRERHHIVPKCLGGSDEKDNLVELTPEEHYVAHQLLVKIYPENGKLVHAAVMMTASRPSNKIYGWLKRLQSSEAKKRTGSKNGSYGTRWVNDGTKSFKIRKDEPLLEGLVEGRIRKMRACRKCSAPIDNGKRYSEICSSCKPIQRKRVFSTITIFKGLVEKQIKANQFPSYRKCGWERIKIDAGMG